MSKKHDGPFPATLARYAAIAAYALANPTLTQKEIASHFGCGQHTVSVAMVYEGIGVGKGHHNSVVSDLARYAEIEPFLRENPTLTYAEVAALTPYSRDQVCWAAVKLGIDRSYNVGFSRSPAAESKLRAGYDAWAAKKKNRA